VGLCETHEVEQGQVRGPVPWYHYRLVDDGIENSLAEKDLGVLIYEKLEMSHQCACTAQKANCLLVCIKSQQVEGGDSASLLCSGESPHGFLCLTLEPSAQGHGTVGVGPEEGDKNGPRAGAPLLQGQAERV